VGTGDWQLSTWLDGGLAPPEGLYLKRMSSSPRERAWEGNEDVAGPFDAGAAPRCVPPRPGWEFFGDGRGVFWRLGVHP
jgi:hypothetical protein